MPNEESAKVREFPIWPFLRQSMVKGAWIGVLGLVLLSIGTYCALFDVMGRSRWGFVLVFTVVGIFFTCWSVIVLLGGAKGLSTRFIVEGETVRLFRGNEERGSLRLDEVHSIKWSQAPFEWYDHSQLELKDYEGNTQLALPIPLMFVPNKLSWPQPDEVSVDQYRQWKGFVADMGQRAQGRERLGPDYDFSTGRERIHGAFTWIRFAVVAGMIPVLCHIGLTESGVLPLPKPDDRTSFSTVIGLQLIGMLGNWFSNRRTEWTVYRTGIWERYKTKSGHEAGVMKYAESESIQAAIQRRRRAAAPARVLLLISAALMFACGIIALVKAGSWAGFLGFGLVSGLIVVGIRYLNAEERGVRNLLQHLDDVFDFREDGTLVVTRPSGETLTLTTTDRAFLARKGAFGTYTDGTTKYVVCPAYMDPVPQAREAEEVARDGR